LCEGVPVGIALVRHEATAEGVRAGNASLERGTGRRESPQPLPLLDDAEPARRGELPDDPMLPALVVSRRPEPARRLAVALDSFEVAVEGEVEVEPGLLPVGDHVEPGRELVADSAGDCVLDELGEVVETEVAEVLARVLEPAGEL